MAEVRSFENAFEMTDYTEELLLVPNQWGLINQLNIFENEGVTQHNVTIEKHESTLSLVGDQVRGARNNVNSDDTRSLLSYPIPHFPLDDNISPSDIQGKRAYGEADASETEARVMQRKIERIRRSHAATLEAARASTIVNGTVYAPNGTVSGNYFTDFGITRKQIAFDLATSTTNVAAKGEEAIAHIQDNIQTGENVDGVIALCSPEFFAALIAQAGVVDAYKYYASTQEPNRQRLGGMGLYREFFFSGVRYIEYRGSYNGTQLLTANEAFIIPTGTMDTFKTYFSPANKFSHVNTMGEEAYMFTYKDPKDEQILIQSEMNVLNLVRRPQVLVRATSAASF